LGAVQINISYDGPERSLFISRHASTLRLKTGDRPIALGAIPTMDARDQLWMLETNYGCSRPTMDARYQLWMLDTNYRCSIPTMDVRYQLWMLETNYGCSIPTMDARYQLWMLDTNHGCSMRVATLHTSTASLFSFILYIINSVKGPGGSFPFTMHMYKIFCR